MFSMNQLYRVCRNGQENIAHRVVGVLSTGHYEELFEKSSQGEKIQVDLKIPKFLGYNVC